MFMSFFISSVAKKLSFFWGKQSRIFLHIVDFYGGQQGLQFECSFKGLYAIPAEQ